MPQPIKTLIMGLIAFGPLAWSIWRFTSSPSNTYFYAMFLSIAWWLVLLAIAGAKRSAREAKILETGEQASARVLAIAPTNSGSDTKPGVRLELEVTPADESAFQCTVETYVHVVHLPQYQPDKIIRVFYTPDRKTVVVEPR